MDRRRQRNPSYLVAVVLHNTVLPGIQEVEVVIRPEDPVRSLAWTVGVLVALDIQYCRLWRVDHMVKQLHVAASPAAPKNPVWSIPYNLGCLQYVRNLEVEERNHLVCLVFSWQTMYSSIRSDEPRTIVRTNTAVVEDCSSSFQV